MTTSLRSQLIRLAASNSEIRAHLLPILKHAYAVGSPPFKVGDIVEVVVSPHSGKVQLANNWSERGSHVDINVPVVRVIPLGAFTRFGNQPFVSAYVVDTPIYGEVTLSEHYWLGSKIQNERVDIDVIQSMVISALKKRGIRNLRRESGLLRGDRNIKPKSWGDTFDAPTVMEALATIPDIRKDPTGGFLLDFPTSMTTHKTYSIYGSDNGVSVTQNM